MLDDILNISDKQKKEFEKRFGAALTEAVSYDGSQKWFNRFKEKISALDVFIRNDILSYPKAVKVSDNNARMIYNIIYPEHKDKPDIIRTTLDLLKITHEKSENGINSIKDSLASQIELYPRVDNQISDHLKDEFKIKFDEAAEAVMNYRGHEGSKEHIKAFQEKFGKLDGLIRKKIYGMGRKEKPTEEQKRWIYDFVYPEHINDEDRPKTTSDLNKLAYLLGKLPLEEIDEEVPEVINAEPEDTNTNIEPKAVQKPLSQKDQETLKKKTRVFIKAMKDHGTTTRRSGKVFIPTNGGSIEEGDGEDEVSLRQYEPRLMILMKHLNKQGIEGQTVAYKDIHIEYGDVAKDMVRPEPYNLVQIERLDIEIAVADCIGEATFVKKGISGEKFWMEMDKNALGAHKHVHRVVRNNDFQWWQEISGVISGRIKPSIDIRAYERFQSDGSDLNRDLVKETILAEKLAYDRARAKAGLTYQPNKGWISGSERRIGVHGEDNGPYIFEHGSYAGLLTVTALESNIYEGSRGFPGGETIADIKQEISNEHGLGYFNPLKQEDWKIDDIGKSLLLYTFKQGQCINIDLKETDKHKVGSYLFEVFKSKGGNEKVPIKRLDHQLYLGRRGLPGSSSVAKQYSKMAEEIGVKGSDVRQDKKMLAAVVNSERNELLEKFKGSVDEMMKHVTNLSFNELLDNLKQKAISVKVKKGWENK